jgi:catechol 2,3-dioxygenase-like lactoylglutathione lyase family enzyme
MTKFSVTGGLDLGLFSDNPAAPAFYENEVGLPFVEALQHSPTYAEKFYSLGGSSLKINHSTEPMPPGRSGYRGLTIARAGLEQPVRLTDPDGLPITLVAPGSGGIEHYAITCEVSDAERQRQFLIDGLGAAPEADFLRLGHALIELVEVPGSGPAGPTFSRGFNYVVAFVDDTPAAHEALIELGATHSVPPTRLPERCVFSWLRDPSGNWLELVQPAALGPLPKVTAIDQRWREIIAWRDTGVAFE